MRLACSFLILGILAASSGLAQNAPWVQISSYSTSFHSGEEARAHNIELAASILNGKIIEPGAIFSFNETIGERTPETGFLKAPYIEGPSKINVNGGGVCLVSSVLYNVALLADLDIVERHPHSRLVPYLPPGQDATVAFGLKDLQFHNRWNDPLRIETLIVGSRLVISLLAPRSLFWYQVSIEPGSAPDRDGSVRAVTYRICTMNGKLLRRELLSEDVYPSSRNFGFRTTGSRTKSRSEQ